MHYEHPVSFEYYRLFEDASQLPDGGFNVDIWQNNEETPPSRKTTKVTTLGSIEVQVETPWESLHQWRNANGDVYRRISYRISMLSTGTSLEWKVYVNGKLQGHEIVTVQQRDS
jgi:hypothetical protein